jgi:hypothetical protein
MRSVEQALEGSMRKMFTIAFLALAVSGWLAAGSAQAYCGPAHACEGAYCTR